MTGETCSAFAGFAALYFFLPGIHPSLHHAALQLSQELRRLTSHLCRAERLSDSFASQNFASKCCKRRTIQIYEMPGQDPPFWSKITEEAKAICAWKSFVFFGRVSSMCAHFDCALTQAWSTPLLEGLRSEVSTWNAQPAFEYRRGPQHFCLLGWIVWGRSHYTDVDMILKWFEHIWYWYVWNRTQFWPFESTLSRPCNTHGFKSWRTLRLPDQCCHLLQLIRKDLKRVRIWRKVFEKQDQALLFVRDSSQSNAAAVYKVYTSVAWNDSAVGN